MKTINQLEAVRKALAPMTPAERTEVSKVAAVTARTIYNIIDPTRTPAYDTVFRVLSALDQMPKKRKARSAV